MDSDPVTGSLPPSLVLRLVDSARRWWARAGLALAEQAVFSGANLALNLIAARQLGPRGYGELAVGSSVLLMASSVQSELVMEPMSVLGAGRYGARQGPYLRRVLELYARLSLVVVAGLLLVAAVVWSASPALGIVLLWVALCEPLVLLGWLVRRVCYLRGDQRTALLSSSLYAVGLLGAMLGVGVSQASTAFVFMGVSALAGAGVAAILQPGLLAAAQGGGETSAREVLRDHWTLGRWTLAASVPNALATLAITPLVAAALSFEDAGLLRAAQNLAAPAAQSLSAWSVLVLPWMARKRVEQGMEGVREALRKSWLLFGGSVVAYSLLLLPAEVPVLHVLYGGDRYLGAAPLLLPILAGLSLQALAQPMTLVLRAIERPRGVLFGKLAAAVGFAACIEPVRSWGVQAAADSVVVVGALEAAVVLACVRAELGREDKARSRT